MPTQREVEYLHTAWQAELNDIRQWTAVDGLHSAGRRSLTQRISDALTFRKSQPSAADEALDLEHSPPSMHVTFQQQPQVIK